MLRGKPPRRPVMKSNRQELHRGAEPGDTLEVRILKIVPKPDAFNFNLPGKDFPTVGMLAPEFPEGFVRYYKLDLVKMQTEFKPGIVIDLQPFPGTFAVGV